MSFLVASAERISSNVPLNLGVSDASGAGGTGGSWTWDAADKVLTLNNVYLDITDEHAIEIPADSKIILTGENIISVTGNDVSGIYSEGSLAISGDGSLSITVNCSFGSGAVFIDSDTVSLLKINIEGALTVKAPNAAAGIFALECDVNISTDDNLTLSGSSYGIMSTRGIKLAAQGKIDIQVTDDVALSSVSHIYAYDDAELIGNVLALGNNSGITGKIESTDGGTVYLAGSIPSGHKLQITGNTVIAAGKTLNNDGTITLSEGYIITNHGTISGSGTITPPPIDHSAALIFVNGENIVNAPNKTINFENGSAVFNSETSTLTLTNAVINKSYQIHPLFPSGIYTNRDIKIVLVGNNEITAGEVGIVNDGKHIEFSGAGTLTTTGEYGGIYSEKGTIVMNALVTATHSGDDGIAILLTAETAAEESAPLTVSPALKVVEGSALKSCKSGGVSYYSYSTGELSFIPAEAPLNPYDVVGGAGKTVTFASTLKHVSEHPAKIPTSRTKNDISTINIAAGVTGGLKPYKFTAEGLPNGIKIDSQNGIIYGQSALPIPAGVAKITATDALGHSILIDVPYGYFVNVSASDTPRTTEGVIAANTSGNAGLAESDMTDILAFTPPPGATDFSFYIRSEKQLSSLALPSSSFDSLQEIDAALKILTDQATVKFNSLAVAAIDSAAGSVDVTFTVGKITSAIAESVLTAKQHEAITTKFIDPGIFSFAVSSSGVKMASLDSGKMSVSIPYNLSSSEAAGGLRLWYISSTGVLLETPFNFDIATNLIEFETDKLGVFVISYDGIDSWQNPYADVKAADWFYKNVWYVVTNELMNGTSPTTFEPDAFTTRAMLVTVLYRLEGSPAITDACPFEDVESDAWYTNAVIWAQKHEIVTGYDENTFGPNDYITREQMATILYRFVTKYKGIDAGEIAIPTKFVDITRTSNYAVPAMCWAVEKELLTGVTAQMLEPQSNATRAQMATVLQRFIQNILSNH